MKKLSITELAQYLNVTKRTVQRRAIKENWPFEERVGLGGTRRMYDYAGLPEQVKSKVAAAVIVRHDNFVDSEGESPGGSHACRVSVATSAMLWDHERAPAQWLAQQCLDCRRSHKPVSRNCVKLGLLALARDFVRRSGEGKIKGFDQFCRNYNARVTELDDMVYSSIPRISRISLLRWEKKEQEMALAQDSPVAENPEPILFDDELRAVAEEVLMIAPQISASRLRQYFLTFFADKPIPEESQLRRWLYRARS